LVVSALVALVLGAGAGLGVFLVVAALRGRAVLPSSSSRSGIDTTRLLRTVATAVGAAVLLYVVTGWLVGALAAAAAAVAAPHLVGGTRRHRDEVARVEAIAAWTEQLRDTIAAANGLEHAIAASGAVAPAPIAPEIGRLVARLDYESLTVALRELADELNHPTADFVAAGLVVASEKEARDLAPLLGQLAECARSEAQMRARVWAGRARTRTSVRVITASVALFAGGLLLFDRPYLEPYGSVGGQLVLLVIVGIFAASFVAMDRMGRIELPDRFLGRRAPEVEA
jgi:tight adherence protein B